MVFSTAHPIEKKPNFMMHSPLSVPPCFALKVSLSLIKREMIRKGFKQTLSQFCCTASDIVHGVSAQTLDYFWSFMDVAIKNLPHQMRMIPDCSLVVDAFGRKGSDSVSEWLKLTGLWRPAMDCICTLECIACISCWSESALGLGDSDFLRSQVSDMKKGTSYWAWESLWQALCQSWVWSYLHMLNQMQVAFVYIADYTRWMFPFS